MNSSVPTTEMEAPTRPLKPTQQLEVAGIARWLASADKDAYALSHVRHAEKLGLIIAAARACKPSIRICLVGHTDAEIANVYKCTSPITNPLLRTALMSMSYADIRISNKPVHKVDLIIWLRPQEGSLPVLIRSIRELQPTAKFLYSFHQSTQEPVAENQWGQRLSEFALYDPFNL
jgi:hypothetical protein